MNATTTRKTLLKKHSNPNRHWVGDGFPVRTLITPNLLEGAISPFLMLDHAGPYDFEPTDKRRGVGAHPHRGFETVTIVYDGEVEHRDSAGGGGIIGPGDVQWMTAASGLVHEEFHGPDFAARGGRFEMAQLWVNLTARDKAAPPNYQPIRRAEIPMVDLPGHAGTLRVIAGQYGDVQGPAETFTPMEVWDVRGNGATTAELPIPDGYNTIMVVLNGVVELADGERLNAADVGIFSRGGDMVPLDFHEDTTLLVLAGEPIDEPVAAYGPFVMNTRAELQEAIDDYNRGNMGSLG